MRAREFGIVGLGGMRIISAFTIGVLLALGLGPSPLHAEAATANMAAPTVVAEPAIVPVGGRTRIEATNTSGLASGHGLAVFRGAELEAVGVSSPISFFVSGRTLLEGPRTYTAKIVDLSTSPPTPVITGGSVTLSSSVFARESIAGGNPSQPCTTRCHVDPVNSATGEFFESVIDLQVARPNVPLVWSRSFATALAGENNGLGHGWVTQYGMHLTGADGASLASSPWVNVIQGRDCCRAG